MVTVTPRVTQITGCSTRRSHVVMPCDLLYSIEPVFDFLAARAVSKGGLCVLLSLCLGELCQATSISGYRVEKRTVANRARDV